MEAVTITEQQNHSIIDIDFSGDINDDEIDKHRLRVIELALETE